MTVSIILPTYNGERWIRRAVESVIAQTFTDWELIVVNDGSTEDVQPLLPGDTRIVYIKNERNLGIQKTLNRGLDVAKGKYIARIDDDDVWSDTTKLEKQVRFLEEHPDHVLVGTGVVVADAAGTELSRYLLPVEDQSIRNKILSKNCFAHSSVMFRNNGMKYLEGVEVKHAEDYEFWLRFGLKGKLANIPEYMTTLTVADTTITAQNRILQAKRVLMIVWKYRKQYAYSFSGISIACARYLGFLIFKILPFPKKLFYRLQKIQKSM